MKRKIELFIFFIMLFGSAHGQISTRAKTNSVYLKGNSDVKKVIENNNRFYSLVGENLLVFKVKKDSILKVEILDSLDISDFLIFKNQYLVISKSNEVHFVDLLDKKHKTIKHFIPFENETEVIKKIYIYDDDILILSSMNFCYTFKNIDSGFSIEKLPFDSKGSNINDIFFFSNSIFFIGEYGVFLDNNNKLNDYQILSYSFLNDGSVILLDKIGRVFLLQKNYKNWQLFFNTDISKARTIYNDGLSGIWVLGESVNRYNTFDKKEILIFDKERDFKSNEAKTIIKLNDNDKFLLGTSGSGFYFFDLKMISNTIIDNNIDSVNQKNDGVIKGIEIKKDLSSKKIILVKQEIFVSGYDFKETAFSYKELDKKLESFLKIKSKFRIDKIELESHASQTIEKGSKSETKSTSFERAKNIKNYLINRGVESSIITIINLADNVLIDANDVYSAKNRAVNVKVYYKKEE
jgi:outer membrane protein OmpA-like peptidoglycan-associated protein